MKKETVKHKGKKDMKGKQSIREQAQSARPGQKTRARQIKLNDSMREDVCDCSNMDEVKMGKGCEKVQGEQNMTSVNQAKSRRST